MSMVLQCRRAEDEIGFFRGLEMEFESTFGELIPGIIHDFANPLNGILGRSELLGRQTEKTLTHITECEGAGVDILENYKKIHGDVMLLAKEVDRLFGMFNNVALKFRALKETEIQEINLSELIESEIAFLWFYPDVKHAVKRKLIFKDEIPEIKGVRADYSIALSTIMKRSVDSMKESEQRELVVTTDCDDSYVHIKIEDTGVPPTEIQKTIMSERQYTCSDLLYRHDTDKGFFYAVSLLKKYGVLFHVACERSINITSIQIPY
jgi:signal transduction histidine kinase